MRQTDMIVDAFNHHILEPAGYELTLNPEALTINQEEERQRAMAFSLYWNCNVPTKTLVSWLGIDSEEGLELEDKERVAAAAEAAQGMAGSEHDAQATESSDPDSTSTKAVNKVLEYAQLRRFIKKGTHLKRPFTSDVLTPLEIAEEVGKAPDAPFLDWESYP
jgi:hypothetical protein